MKIPKPPPYNENHERLIAFTRSETFHDVCEQLRPRFARCRHFEKSVEGFVRFSVSSALSRSDIQDRATAGDITKLANTIISSATELEKALELVCQNGSFEFPFQGHIDYLALSLANEYYCEGRKEDAPWEESDEDAHHRCRYAIYFTLMRRMGDVLDTFRIGAEQLLELKATVKQPHGANADRLYFIRKLTESFFRTFGTPCRSHVLR
nr:hypothetical protein [Pseudomonadota bacterium]